MLTGNHWWPNDLTDDVKIHQKEMAIYMVFTASIYVVTKGLIINKYIH